MCFGKFCRCDCCPKNARSTPWHDAVLHSSALTDLTPDFCRSGRVVVVSGPAPVVCHDLFDGQLTHLAEVGGEWNDHLNWSCLKKDQGFAVPGLTPVLHIMRPYPRACSPDPLQIGQFVPLDVQANACTARNLGAPLRVSVRLIDSTNLWRRNSPCHRSTARVQTVPLRHSLSASPCRRL